MSKNSNLNQILHDLFERFNLEDIKYLVIRDYFSVETINNSDDLDISISSMSRNRAIELLKEMGWGTPQINPNTFSHQQFYKWDGNRMYKVDVLWDVFFADGKYKLSNVEEIYDKYKWQENIKIPTPNIGLKLLLLHVILDKRIFSEKNKKSFIKLSSENELYDGCIGSISSEILSTCDFDLKNLEKYKTNLEAEKLIERCNNIFWKIQRWIIIKKWSRKTNCITLALIGVDGTGKSKALENLSEYYKDTAQSTYMGFRSYQTGFAKRMTARPVKIPVLSTFLLCFSLYIEMMYRLIKAKTSRKHLILFDRYPWEAYINAGYKQSKFWLYIFMLCLFPKPTGTVYLYCPANVSLKRKTDIENAEEFVKMKERFDKLFLDNRFCKSLDTSILDIDDVKSEIIQYICMLTNGRYR